MALVPFRVLGAAADQDMEQRMLQFGGMAVTVRQIPKHSGSVARAALPQGEHPQAGDDDSSKRPSEDLSNVGLVVWQSAFMLAEFLLRAPPFGQWHDVRVVDLGSGTGVVGIALAKAGADVVLADLPHITPLTQANVDANCQKPYQRTQVVQHAWGEDVGVLGKQKPDIIAGADLLYAETSFPSLVRTLNDLSAPHTITFLAFKRRGRGETSFPQMLADAGFAVDIVPDHELHEEYQGTDYCLLRACKLS